LKSTRRENSITSKVIIICKKHGKFTQQPGSHLRGYGCIKCGYLKYRTTDKSDAENFAEKAINIQGSKYDYSLVDYINNRKKVIIVCAQHGEFTQTPSAHLGGGGTGYILCGRLSSANIRKKSTAEFIEEATKIYGDKYDYSHVNYIRNKDKVTIVCKQHGEFTKQAREHLKGLGCNECRKLSKKRSSMQ
jgi:hypothetical protein